MVNKLKLFCLTVNYPGCSVTYSYVFDYSSLKNYLSNTGKLFFLKRKYRYYHPLPLKVDGRSSAAIFLYYAFSALPRNYYDINGNYYPFSFRTRTLSEATSDKILSNGYCDTVLSTCGVLNYSVNTFNGASNDAVFSSPLRLPEHLFKSGDWKEYHYLSKET